ncbi:hypothetical protein GPX89_25195 [Nocardia sp. ET3-3]|uniref:Secreted protein n=2 Tax=Nocardia terrae TaxID=2675851 RepID=A0A7K1V219_9NOCA|nr:hypothetical protein [Nocardia terrae]
MLFLDIDGPLIPFVGPNPPLTRLDHALGPLLTALRCELVWATTWAQEANRSVSPLLGFPELEVMEWDDTDHHVDNWFGLHWKTRGLVDRAAGRPFVWIDDELTDRDREWVAANHAGPALLHWIDPRIGLHRTDFDEIARWLAQPADSWT